jgi:putative oxidoreductase
MNDHTAALGSLAPATSTEKRTQAAAALIGRALLATLFIAAGMPKLVGFAEVTGYIASKGVPLPEVCAAIAVAAELGLGVLLLVGFKARWAALGLAIFTAVITPIFHGYWAVPDAMVNVQRVMFWKNYAIVGGLLMVTALGAGALSIDGRKSR